jgi:hypothetical protein
VGRIHVFADEAGNLDFGTGPGATRYFILTTVTLTDCSVGDALLSLRRQLAWEGVEQVTADFHATAERQEVRDRVFGVLGPLPFRVDATIFEKRNAVEKLRTNEPLFYETAWRLHFNHVAKRIAGADDELLVVAASIGTRKQRGIFHKAVHDVVEQTAPVQAFRTASWAAASDPCLWVADFCAWAIQRKWEQRDPRSHVLIQDKIATEFLMFDDRARKNLGM